jgi:hypothetical protein
MVFSDLIGRLTITLLYSTHRTSLSRVLTVESLKPMRMQAAAPLVVTLLCLLALPGAAHATGPKACDLLNAQTATSLLGAAVGVPTNMNGMTCSYLATPGSATVFLGIADMSGTDGAHTIEVLQVMASKEAGSTTKSIAGLGEQSFLVTRTSNKNAIVLVYHQKLLTLKVERPMSADLEKAMVQTMQQALAKL